ncbi:hypothetical protein FIBSPDRAFT_742018, partial [Athelia psychrophila]
YNAWCASTGTESKLPQALKSKREAAADANAALEQATLDSHLRNIHVKQKTIVYSDAEFRAASIEWLVSTDQQPIQAFEHPSFKRMIDVAARAVNGVIIPNRKATREEIIDLFKRQLTKLKERLTVCLL